MATNETVPLGEALFTDSTEGPRLLGSHCRVCEHVQFPPMRVCPACLASEVDAKTLAPMGRLLSFTRMHMDSANFRAPYVLAYVKLEDGIELFAPLVDTPDLYVGALVRVEIAQLWSVRDVGITGYRFRVDPGRTA